MAKDIHPTRGLKNKKHKPSTIIPRSTGNKPHAFEWLDGPYNHVRGETALWVAVITQAMMDALSRSGNAEALYHKHETISWLTGNSRDFAMVCHFAGLEPGYVRRKAKRTLAAPRPWRAEPGKGKRYAERKEYRKRLKSLLSREHYTPIGYTEAQRYPEDDTLIVGPWERHITLRV